MKIRLDATPDAMTDTATADNPPPKDSGRTTTGTATETTTETTTESASPCPPRRLEHPHSSLPLLASCCPAWTDWMEKYAPDFTENFSTAKSPRQMLSSLAKSYWAEKNGVDPKNVFMVSIMPCTSKKYEISRDEYMAASGQQDTDVVLTTRELARLIQHLSLYKR